MIVAYKYLFIYFFFLVHDKIIIYVYHIRGRLNIFVIYLLFSCVSP